MQEGLKIAVNAAVPATMNSGSKTVHDGDMALIAAFNGEESGWLVLLTRAPTETASI